MIDEEGLRSNRDAGFFWIALVSGVFLLLVGYFAFFVFDDFKDNDKGFDSYLYLNIVHAKHYEIARLYDSEPLPVVAEDITITVESAFGGSVKKISLVDLYGNRVMPRDDAYTIYPGIEVRVFRNTDGSIVFEQVSGESLDGGLCEKLNPSYFKCLGE